MGERQKKSARQTRQRIFTAAEKENYCNEFQRSGMKQIDFCEQHGISKSALYKWLTESNKGENCHFSAVVEPLLSEGSSVIDFEVRFPDQIRMHLSLPQSQLILFIQELAHAIAITR